MNWGDVLALVVGDYTIRTVLLGAAVFGVVSGVLSCFAVLRRQALLGDAMSHAALPGVVLAFILTGSKAMPVLMLGALIAGWVGVLFVLFVTHETRIKEDSALGIVLAVFFGVGLMLLTWVQRTGPASQSGLDKFLFGRAAALVMEDVATMALVGMLGLLCVALFWKEFKLLSFDPAYAATLGFPTRRLDVLLTTLIVLAVVVGLQMVGVVLMSAMLVAPGAAARQWTDKLGLMVTLGGLFGAFIGVVGALVSSFVPNLPTGPTIVVVATVLVLVSLTFAPHRGMVAQWWRRRQQRRQVHRRAVLAAMASMAAHHPTFDHPHEEAAIRAALGGRDVRPTLDVLEQEGLVQRANGQRWALTARGRDVVQQRGQEEREA